eukprot:CAMPEP_0182892056 /NCGR_PEP_ID=MMETSP0034_2-20130328/23637_1 /TAXON_ID=156128 /ORGANISM="Nephroselmis pyriformis, Strain CCMP717" /LENGTH=38 /DNA_ID= /DNA_START= /DNA_END= /DNA_ORIENTATION=
MGPLLREPRARPAAVAGGPLHSVDHPQPVGGGKLRLVL